MKLKYYLRGLGVGIVLTTLIISISGSRHKLTDHEIITRAMELGMVMRDDPKGNLDEVMEAKGSVTPAPQKDPEHTTDEEISSDPDDPFNTEGASDPEEALGTEGAPDTEVTLDTEGASDTEKTEGEQADEPDGAVPNDSRTEDSITFSVQKGMSSGQVAALLESIGLIQNAADFNDYIIRKGKAGAIMIGKYTVPGDATYEVILKAITKE